jgi:trans-aconitate 2-methyltransferase
VSRDWDPVTYDRVSTVQVEWAAEVLERLELRGDETVLDAGCGSGRVTAMLLERLPRGHVIAVDASPSMIAFAREALDDRATVLRQDLLDLEVPEPVDVVFSNAVFHWVLDHPRLFRRLHAAVRPGGIVEAQYGGFGNVERFLLAADAVSEREPYAQYLADWSGRPWYMTTDDQARGWLEEAGFEDVRAWLQVRPMRPSEPRDYIRSVCLGFHLERLPEDLRAPYVDAVAERMPPELDYVRLNVSARRGE